MPIFNRPGLVYVYRYTTVLLHSPTPEHLPKICQFPNESRDKFRSDTVGEIEADSWHLHKKTGVTQTVF